MDGLNWSAEIFENFPLPVSKGNEQQYSEERVSEMTDFHVTMGRVRISGYMKQCITSGSLSYDLPKAICDTTQYEKILFALWFSGFAFFPGYCLCSGRGRAC